MTFQMHHKIVLSHPYDAVFPVMSSSEHFERLQYLTPSILTFELLPSDSVKPITSLSEIPSFPRPIDLEPTDDLNAQERINFKFTRHVLFQTIEVRGSQIVIPHLRAVLFESQVKQSGIRVLKLRICTSLEGGEKTEVEETVWGTASPILAKFLSWTGMAARTHKGHMVNYHKLFDNVPGVT